MASGINRLGALDKAFEFIYKSETIGNYCEFGVYQGVSIVRALQAEKKWRKKMGKAYVDQFYGFDSFKGLPNFTNADTMSNYEVFQPGQFDNTSIQQVYELLAQENLPKERVSLFEGYFEDTLFSEETLKRIQYNSIAIVHIDCDLYSSAVQCLDFLTRRIADGAVILFDDWFCYRGRQDKGVHKAFDEWCRKEDYHVSDYFSYSWAGRAFIVNTL